MVKQQVVTVRAILLGIITLILGMPGALWGAPKSQSPNKSVITVPPAQVITVKGPDGKDLLCAPRNGEYVPVRWMKGSKYQLTSQKVTALKAKLKEMKADNASNKEIKKAKKQLKNAITNQDDMKDACDAGGGSVVPDEDAVSLAALDRTVTHEDVHLLLERGGFGLDTSMEFLLDKGAQGISALVDEFMGTRGEDPAVTSYLVDLLDGQLGSTHTQTPGGQRSALLYRWANTSDPYSEKLAIFLLSTWVVAGDVISDETFRGAFWDYFERLRSYAQQETDLIQLGKDITRDPLMLIYLNNEKNIKGNPNENYARELMELFTMGPTNINGDANYTETTLDGGGDIGNAAKILTGHQVKLNYITNKLERDYKENLHETGPFVMFAGKSYQFSASKDDELVQGIFNNHPAVKYFYARKILNYYLSPNPPRALIENFGEVIAQNNYKLRPSMATLFKSKAFYHPIYVNTLPKDSIEFAVESLRLLGLSRGFNAGEAERQLQLMGMKINEAPSVFWFNPSAWTSPSVIIERANFVGLLLGDLTAQAIPEPDWTPGSILPSGMVSATDVINYASGRLGVSLNTNIVATLEQYMSKVKQWDGTYSSKQYDNTSSSDQRTKGMGIYYILSSQPDFQLK